MKNSTKKKLKIGAAVLSVAIVCFCACSFALSKTSLSSRLGIFGAGSSGDETPSRVSVDINGGEDIIEKDLIINPGDTVTRTFFIKNTDSDPIYFGFTGISGNLKDYLDVKLESELDGKDSEGEMMFVGEPEEETEVLFEGKASELESFNADKDYVIYSGETKEFTITFVYPESAGNGSSNSLFNFQVICDYRIERGNG